MGNFIVYKHTSPSGKCYVGITSQAPECRWGNDGCKYLAQSLSCNITDGGEGICGFQFPGEQREKLGESHKGKKQSSET